MLPFKGFQNKKGKYVDKADYLRNVLVTIPTQLSTEHGRNWYGHLDIFLYLMDRYRMTPKLIII